ncbi:MAG: DUF1624 domain-containing protein [Candidatus Aenigmarchaeota archaeon]|nr:DUF1624 domain-containing protein [Candidatus Aenigmarchaeota archaeon]
MQKRFFELDFLRGIAIMLMIFYHILFDLNYFAGFSFELWSGVFWIVGRTAAFIFIFLVGVSLTISYSRARVKIAGFSLFKKYFLRGFKIFSWGLLVTTVTYLFLPEGTIYFGVLHFIGVSIVLAYPFLRFRYLNLFLAAIFVVIGFCLKQFVFGFSYLLFLGFTHEHFYTLDYFPIFPWFAVVLLGIFFGNTFYAGGQRRFLIPDLSAKLKPLLFIGRNSLLIYLLHQPILTAIILSVMFCS